MKNSNAINCPKCGYSIDIKDLIQQGAQEQLEVALSKQKTDFEKKMQAAEESREKLRLQLEKEKEKYSEELRNQMRAEFEGKEKKLKEHILETDAASRKVMEEEIARQSAKLKEMDKLKATLLQYEKSKDAAVSEALAAQKIAFAERESRLRAEGLAEGEETRRRLEADLKSKSERLKELNILRADKVRLEREKEELASELSAKAEAEFSLKLKEAKASIARQETERNELVIAELKKQLEDQRKMTEEMRVKQEQGSMQLQGEVQELAIEKWLKEKFLSDEIEEIGKGDMGADSIQFVRNTAGKICGSIYYESKRTKVFQEAWIGKLKKDMMEKKADIGVIVTAVYPKEMDRMGFKDGIYICTYDEFKGLCVFLRDILIKVSAAYAAEENKNEKSVVLYKFLTSNEFKMQFEGIVSAFRTLKDDFEKEKRAIQSQWKKRECQLENVLTITANMYGSIRGIAGNSVPRIEGLELEEVHNSLSLTNE